MASPRTWSRYTRQAAVLLGERIRQERKQRRWSEQELASRAGISRATLQKIESGDMGCAIGLAFEAAALVGIPLFASDRQPLPGQVREARDKTALLPTRIRAPQEPVFDDF